MEAFDQSVSKPTKTVKKNTLIWLIAGLIIGIVGTIGLRVIRAKNPYVHYHANFAVYINGSQDLFQGPGYYEEVTACDVHNADDVKSRVHMHANVNHVVHVHDHGVTWGDFFNNIGYTLGDKVLSDGTNVYVNGQDGKQLTFILNGQKMDNIANKVIKSEDVLLINYGNENEAVLKQYYQTIPRDAHHYNISKDPAACSGSEVFDFKSRLKDALGVNTSF